MSVQVRFLGTKGVGKTTLLYKLLGFELEDDDEIIPTKEETNYEIALKIGNYLQDIVFIDNAPTKFNQEDDDDNVPKLIKKHLNNNPADFYIVVFNYLDDDSIKEASLM